MYTKQLCVQLVIIRQHIAVFYYWIIPYLLNNWLSFWHDLNNTIICTVTPWMEVCHPPSLCLILLQPNPGQFFLHLALYHPTPHDHTGFRKSYGHHILPRHNTNFCWCRDIYHSHNGVDGSRSMTVYLARCCPAD